MKIEILNSLLEEEYNAGSTVKEESRLNVLWKPREALMASSEESDTLLIDLCKCSSVQTDN